LRPGATYNLVFSMAGNPGCGAKVKVMEVFFGGNLVALPSFDTTGHTTSNMGWTIHHYRVTASTIGTRIEFDSLNSGVCGPAIDGVIVIQV
jgi:hypothetical protein